jgi:hypothetical protein
MTTEQIISAKLEILKTAMQFSSTFEELMKNYNELCENLRFRF